MVLRKAKFSRQGTFAPQDSDILNAIDQKFEEMEETIILASLVPQLHERLHAVEQMLRIDVAAMWSPDNVQLDMETEPKPPKPIWGEEASPKASAQAKSASEKDFTPVNLESTKSEAKVEPNVSDLTSMTPASKRASVPKVIEISRSKVKEMDEKTLDTQTCEYYTFGESTWDLVIFIGTGALGPFGSFQTFLLAIVNVLMQVVFVAIAYYNFTTPDINESSIVDSLRWRRSSGHSFADYSLVAKESLVHRVCKEDKSLASSGLQVGLIENINKYLKLEAEGLEGFFTGQILCIVALICWYLMVAKEVSHALALHRGIMAMRRGPTKLDTRENPFTQVTHYRLRAVSMSRKLFSGFLLLYRLLAATLLVIVGTTFLVYTVNVTELILNAVALGIILDIDDLLFDALATTPGRHLVHQLDPLHMPSMPRVRGADAKSVFMSVFIPGLTILVYYFMLEPFVGTLTQVKSAMCGGNQNFVWSTDKRRITHLSPTFGGGWEEEEDSIKTDAIVEGETIGYGLSMNETRFGVWVSDVTVLSDLEAADLDDLIEEGNVACGDLGNQEPLLNYLRYMLGNESIQSCADVTMHCSSITKMPEFALDGGVGWSTRMLCSESCGCQNPGGDFINVQGCPYNDGECKASVPFQEHKESGLCLDRNASTLRELGSWKEWIKTIRSYGESASDLLSGKSDALLLAQAMEDNGCGFLSNLSAQNISLGGCFSWDNRFTWEFKTLEFFCPITCGCSSDNSQRSGCPEPFGKSCDQLSRSRCLTWNDQHFCPGFNTEIIYALMMYDYSSPDVMNANKEAARLAFREAFAQYAGHTEAIDVNTVTVDLGWLGFVYARVYLTDLATMNSTEMTASLYSTPLEDYQAAVDASLLSSGVTLSDLALTLSFAGDPKGPYGGYGYGYSDYAA
ncbi:unnamed protein product [Durusdinium trenchii]|uniref:Uncharacterized protein n=1 Tax=Durusdinium trenchii TaxID=1381693 RepID=A0ABP0HRB7_9DINO